MRIVASRAGKVAVTTRVTGRLHQPDRLEPHDVSIAWPDVRRVNEHAKSGKFAREAVAASAETHLLNGRVASGSEFHRQALRIPATRGVDVCLTHVMATLAYQTRHHRRGINAFR